MSEQEKEKKEEEMKKEEEEMKKKKEEEKKKEENGMKEQRNKNDGKQYKVLDILGAGTFGQVVRCENLETKEKVAVKVIKNKPAYHHQALMEVKLLQIVWKLKQIDIN